jgi:hypothetical protein
MYELNVRPKTTVSRERDITSIAEVNVILFARLRLLKF